VACGTAQGADKGAARAHPASRRRSGRSCRGGIDDDDKRGYLYREYLRILAEHEPPVFIMENVKGLLSSRVAGSGLFAKILADLHAAGRSVGHKRSTAQYRVFSLVQAPQRFDRPDEAVNKRFLSTGETGEFTSESMGFGLNPGVGHAVPRCLSSNQRERRVRKNLRNVADTDEVGGGRSCQRNTALELGQNVVAPRHGFEPRFTAPKAAVLPLDDRGSEAGAIYSVSTNPPHHHSEYNVPSRLF
jgi:hypothetical protein